jgi:S-adenosylmethionine-diacylgycerolhomoserine-N-methlytransferase
VNADATNYQPAKSPDIVTFSYSLTMIPDWFAVIDKAFEMLKPGGLIGVVDFYVSRKWPEKGMKKHSAWTRGFWPAWFSYDNVFVSPEHLPYLMKKFNPVIIEEWRGNVPYMLGMKAPYYLFVGRKPI